MTLRHLKVFVTVCKYGSVTRAAEELRIAQPSVTLTIKELESYYNVVLFNRIHQRLVLTDLGKEALLRAQDVLSSFDAFETLVRQSDDHMSLRIGATLTIGKSFIPSFWKWIMETYPSVPCTVSVYQAHVVEQLIEEGELDFALVEGKVFSRNLISYELGRDILVAVASPSCPEQGPMPLRELPLCRLLLREHGSATRDLLEHMFAVNGVTAHPVMESASNEALISAAEAGLGITVLPLALVEDRIGKTLCRLTITDANLERDSYLIHHKNKKFTPTQLAIFKQCLAMMQV